MTDNFEREERYIVVKINRLTPEGEYRLREFLYSEGIDTINSVVIEHDWPEYEPVWKMIQNRMETVD